MEQLRTGELHMTQTQRRLPPLMDIADFIDWPGDGSDTRYELVDGVLRAMAPGSDVHNTIVMTLGVLVANQLQRTRPGCRVVASPGIQPRVRANWNFRIPDLGVTCAPARAGDIMTPDPILLVEVLSPGNAGETWENVMAYTTLPSVLEILVVHSTRVKAELLRRDAAGAWPADPQAIEAGGAVSLATIGLELPLAQAYAGTHLA
jgi:Uma2 family endonuclease